MSAPYPRLSKVRPVLALAAMLSVPACTSVQPYWLAKDRSGNYATIGQLPENLKVIEFDELGDLWSESQRDEAIQRIQNCKQPPLVVTFTHGWRHSARNGDANLESFKGLIEDLKASLKSREVVGIYIGWRGGSLREPNNGALTALPALFTFHNRKNATDRLAGIPMGETFWRIHEATNARRGSSLLVGHSFGGRIIERCVGQYIVAAKRRSSIGEDRVQSPKTGGIPADLILLINPASESLYAQQIKRALDGWGNRPPGIISVTTDSDFATNKAWALAMHLTGPIKGYYGFRKEVQDRTDTKPSPMRELQFTYLTRTAGHDDRLIDRDVRSVGDGITLNPEEDVIARNVSPSPQRDWFWIAPSKGEPAVRYYLDSHQPRDRHFPKLPYGKANGYWVLSVDSAILEGHSGEGREGVFNTPMIHLVAGLYGRAQSNLKPTRTHTQKR